MYENDFLFCMKYLHEAEGVFSDDPDDKGGKTKFGITEATARSMGYKGKMEDLSKQEAERIYYLCYWGRPHINLIENIELKLLLFMFGVNKNPKRAIQCLQVGFNHINYKGRYGPDLVEDGVIGGKTLTAINRFKDDRRIIHSVTAEIVVYYRTITKKNPVNRKFYAGWLEKRVLL